MLDWEKMRPQSNQYTPPQNPSQITQPLGGGTSTGGSVSGLFYPPPPQKPSCFESKCLNCPFKDKCKNKE